MSADRVFWQQADPSTRWRHRFFALAAALTLLAPLAWHFTGRQGPSPGALAAVRASMAALQARNALPAAAYGSAWPGQSPKPSAAVIPKPDVTASARPAASPAGTGSRPVQRHPRPRGTPARTARR